MKPLFVFLAFLSSSVAATILAFGECYPHTRWIDEETHSIQVDAYPHRLVITPRGEPSIVIHGCWQGRSFLRDCKIDYFGVAHEGVTEPCTETSALRDTAFDGFALIRPNQSPAMKDYRSHAGDDPDANRLNERSKVTDLRRRRTAATERA